MTHHQIPNEICIWKSQMIEFLDSRRKEVAIGVNQDNYDGALYYIRKDVFIGKACVAYCKVCDTQECDGTYECDWVAKFRRRLKKELKQE